MTVNLSFDRSALPFRTDFSVAGARCLLSTNSHHVLQHAQRWRTPEEKPAGAHFQMELLEDSTLDRVAPEVTHFRGMRHLVFAIMEPRTFVTYDLLRREVRAVLSTPAAKDHSFWKGKLLPITIGLMGTTLGIAPLHCACVALDGHGILIAGVSGAGKSTLTAALARRGFAAISDDWTYVSHRSSGLRAAGLSAPIKLLPDSVRFFDELQSRTPHKTLNGEIAYEIRPEHFHPGAVHSAICKPRWILFLERTSIPGCRFLPCRGEHTRQFFENSAERLPEELADGRQVRSQIIRRLSERPAWLLSTGDDPAKTAEAIENFARKASDGNR